MKILSSLSKVAGGLSRVALGIAATGLGVMALIIAWQVFGRYVLNDSPSWAEPLGLLLMLWFIMLAGAVGVRERFHISLSLLESLLPRRAAIALDVVVLVIVAGFGVLMAINGVRLVDYTAAHIIPGLEVSRAFAYVPFAAGGALFALFAVERILERLIELFEPEVGK